MDVLDSELSSEIDEVNDSSISNEQLIGSTENNGDCEISFKCSVDSRNTLNIGDRVEVLWPDDDIYYANITFSYNTEDNKHKIYYDDSDTEDPVMSTETWKYENFDIIVGNDVQLKPGTELKSNEKEAIQKIYERVKKRGFLRNDAESPPQIFGKFIREGRRFLQKDCC